MLGPAAELRNPATDISLSIETGTHTLRDCCYHLPMILAGSETSIKTITSGVKLSTVFILRTLLRGRISGGMALVIQQS